MGGAERTRDSSPLLAACAGNQTDHRPDSGLVRLAAVAPGSGAILSLQTTYRAITTTVVLVKLSVTKCHRVAWGSEATGRRMWATKSSSVRVGPREGATTRP